MTAPCPTCHGDGWTLDDDLNASVCPDCGGVPTRVRDLRESLSAVVDAHRGKWVCVPIDVLDGLLTAAHDVQPTPDGLRAAVEALCQRAELMVRPEHPGGPFVHASALREALAQHPDPASGEAVAREALESARDALYRGEGPDFAADADIVYGEWLGNRAVALATETAKESTP